MRVEHDVELAPRTTLGLGGRATRFVRVASVDDLREALAIDRTAPPCGGAAARAQVPSVDPRVLVLGGGSNLVIGDGGWDGLVIQIAIRGISIDGDAVSVAAGESWDDFVAHMVEDGRAGVECLSGIPGLAGATPMQNVGAYGQDVAQTITSVRAYDRERGELVTLRPDECGFGYRTSRFRGSERWIVTDVAFRLPRAAVSAPVSYPELARALGVATGATAPLAEVRRTVIELRRAKGMVVDSADPESRSAGSFFTNPIVVTAVAALLPADAPRWPQPDGRVKLSAAWLIERAGFAKGYTVGAVGISRKHALALVHRGGGTTRELLALARDIRDRVQARLGIELEIEPVVAA
jgi:UDP-N-acetylmuramate dehydrogenase